MKELFGLVVDTIAEIPYFSKVKANTRYYGDYELGVCLRETGMAGVLHLDRNDYIAPQQLLEWSTESS